MYVDSDQLVEQKRLEFSKELLQNKALWEQYTEYRENDVESLINSYALYKARLKVQGNYTETHHQMHMTEWTDRCWFALCEIQSKKLFDLQCLWRAKEIPDLPLIKWSYNFDPLPVPILDYEGIPDITPDEVETYIRFLDTPQGEAQINYYLSNYQDYSHIKEAYMKEDGYIPEYYEYQYTVKGNTGLLTLPDLRKDREHHLMKLAVNYNKNKSAKTNATTPIALPTKKYLSYHETEVKVAMAIFLGEKDVAGFIKDLDRWVKEKPSYETDWATNYLTQCYPEKVPMPAAHCWQEAIEKAALQHISLKVKEMLPVVYDEYLMKKQLGSAIGHVSSENDVSYEHPLIQLLDLGERLDRGEFADSDGHDTE